MQFLAAFHQTEPLTQLAVQGFCVVAHNFKTAASRWAFRPERADDVCVRAGLLPLSFSGAERQPRRAKHENRPLTER
jgi:hypothetical protein